MDTSLWLPQHQRSVMYCRTNFIRMRQHEGGGAHVCVCSIAGECGVDSSAAAINTFLVEGFALDVPLRRQEVRVQLPTALTS